MTTMFKATMFKAKRTAQRLQPAGHWKLNLPLHGTAWRGNMGEVDILYQYTGPF